MDNSTEGTLPVKDYIDLKDVLFINTTDKTTLIIPMTEGDKLNKALYDFCIDNKIDATLITNGEK
jgi:hypothetical protein